MGPEIPAKYGIKRNDVKFTSTFGSLIYYSTLEKRQTPYKEQLHQDLVAALEGKNSGWFYGLNYEIKPGKEDMYVEATPNYVILSDEEAKEWEEKIKPL